MNDRLQRGRWSASPGLVVASVGKSKDWHLFGEKGGHSVTVLVVVVVVVIVIVVVIVVVVVLPVAGIESCSSGSGFIATSG